VSPVNEPEQIESVVLGWSPQELLVVTSVRDAEKVWRDRAAAVVREAFPDDVSRRTAALATARQSGAGGGGGARARLVAGAVPEPEAAGHEQGAGRDPSRGMPSSCRTRDQPPSRSSAGVPSELPHSITASRSQFDGARLMPSSQRTRRLSRPTPRRPSREETRSVAALPGESWDARPARRRRSHRLQREFSLDRNMREAVRGYSGEEAWSGSASIRRSLPSQRLPAREEATRRLETPAPAASPSQRRRKTRASGPRRMRWRGDFFFSSASMAGRC
jgi:hypothetical protein